MLNTNHSMFVPRTGTTAAYAIICSDYKLYMILTFNFNLVSIGNQKLIMDQGNELINGVQYAT